jgi:hypothetical protein
MSTTYSCSLGVCRGVWSATYGANRLHQVLPSDVIAMHATVANLLGDGGTPFARQSAAVASSWQEAMRIPTERLRRRGVGPMSAPRRGRQRGPARRPQGAVALADRPGDFREAPGGHLRRDAIEDAETPLYCSAQCPRHRPGVEGAPSPAGNGSPPAQRTGRALACASSRHHQDIRTHFKRLSLFASRAMARSSLAGCPARPNKIGS